MSILIAIVNWITNNGLPMIAIVISVISLRISVRINRHNIALEGSRLKSEVLITFFDAQFRLKEAQDRVLNSPGLFSECTEGKQKMLSSTIIPLLEQAKVVYDDMKNIPVPPHPGQMHTSLIHVNELRKMMGSMEVSLNTVIDKCAACVNKNQKPCIEIVSS